MWGQLMCEIDIQELHSQILIQPLIIAPLLNLQLHDGTLSIIVTRTITHNEIRKLRAPPNGGKSSMCTLMPSADLAETLYECKFSSLANWLCLSTLTARIYSKSDLFAIIVIIIIIIIIIINCQLATIYCCSVTKYLDEWNQGIFVQQPSCDLPTSARYGISSFFSSYVCLTTSNQSRKFYPFDHIPRRPPCYDNVMQHKMVAQMTAIWRAATYFKRKSVGNIVYKKNSISTVNVTAHHFTTYYYSAVWFKQTSIKMRTRAISE
jgi:hypothetical protein